MQTLETKPKKETNGEILPNANDYISLENLVEIKKKAEEGDGKSQYALALYYRNSEGINNDIMAELYGIRATNRKVKGAAYLVGEIIAERYEKINQKYGSLDRMGEKEKLLNEAIFWFKMAKDSFLPDDNQKLATYKCKLATYQCKLAELYINRNKKISGKELYQEAANEFYEIEEYSQAANCYSVLASYEYPNYGESTKKLIELANKHNDPVALFSLGERCLKDIKKNDIADEKWASKIETAINYLSKAKEINEFEPKLSKNQADNCVGHLDNSLFKLSKYYCSKGKTLKANELFQKITFKRYYKDQEAS